jgi:hypothetical protein
LLAIRMKNTGTPHPISGTQETLTGNYLFVRTAPHKPPQHQQK